jgi:hypothetical protein
MEKKNLLHILTQNVTKNKMKKLRGIYSINYIFIFTHQQLEGVATNISKRRSTLLCSRKVLLRFILL